MYLYVQYLPPWSSIVCASPNIASRLVQVFTWPLTDSHSHSRVSYVLCLWVDFHCCTFLCVYLCNPDDNIHLVISQLNYVSCAVSICLLSCGHACIASLAIGIYV